MIRDLPIVRRRVGAGTIAFVAGEMVEFSRRWAIWLSAVLLLLSIVGAIFAAQRLHLDTDIDKLMSPDLPWRQREAGMERAFPQNIDLLVVVVDGDTPDRVQDASAALTRYLSSETTLFRSVRRAGASEFFEREGLLFLSKSAIQQVTDKMIAAQPLLGTLAADPSLRGVFDSLDLAAQGAIHGATGANTLTTPSTPSPTPPRPRFMTATRRCPGSGC